MDPHQGWARWLVFVERVRYRRTIRRRLAMYVGQRG